jgi:hypothetical protein
MQDILGAHQDALVTEERLRELAHELDETGISFVAGRFAERERPRRDQIHERLRLVEGAAQACAQTRLR